MKNKFGLLCAIPIAALLTLASSKTTHADPILIDYGVVEGGIRFIDLLPNTPNQVVQLFASGIADEGGVNGFELDIQIGDGGEDLGGSDVGPVFASVDLETGTVWDESSTQDDVQVFPLARQSTIEGPSLLNTDGLIGSFTIDTTGFAGTELEFRMTGVADVFDSTFFRGGDPISTTAPNGRIRISAVPEPGSLALLAFAPLWMLRRRRVS
ncbi:MAG: PEP-CTERM sorting domain-containing protein [Pirellulaceae bacterium]